MMLIAGRRAFVGHVGDARAYLLRFARLEALTADDAIFADAHGVAGSAKSSLPARPRSRGLLWRSLGTQAKLEAVVAHVDLLVGDQIILCTDGIHGCISSDEMCGVMLEARTSCDAATRLLAMMKMRGGLNNGTVIVGRDLTTFDAPVPARRKKIPMRKYFLLAGTSLAVALALLFFVLLR
jgi:protein phosphatase